MTLKKLMNVIFGKVSITAYFHLKSFDNTYVIQKNTQ